MELPYFVYHYRSGKFITRNFVEIEQIAYLYPEVQYAVFRCREDAIKYTIEPPLAKNAIVGNWAYCDASFFEVEKKGGWAFVVNGILDCGETPWNTSSGVMAEIFAIYKTLSMAYSIGLKQVTLSTDCQYAISILTHLTPQTDNRGMNNDIVSALIDPALIEVTRQYLALVEVIFLWCPSHTGIYWNEIVDHMSRNARNQYRTPKTRKSS